MGHRKSSLSSGSQKVPQEKLWDKECVIGREESATHGQGASSSNNVGSAGGSGSGSGACAADDSQLLEAERAALLRAKQAELDAIEDKHDDLVRCQPSFGSHAHVLCVTPVARSVVITYHLRTV